MHFRPRTLLLALAASVSLAPAACGPAEANGVRFRANVRAGGFRGGFRGFHGGFGFGSGFAFSSSFGFPFSRGFAFRSGFGYPFFGGYGFGGYSFPSYFSSGYSFPSYSLPVLGGYSLPLYQQQSYGEDTTSLRLLLLYLLLQGQGAGYSQGYSAPAMTYSAPAMPYAAAPPAAYGAADAPVLSQAELSYLAPLTVAQQRAYLTQFYPRFVEVLFHRHFRHHHRAHPGHGRITSRGATRRGGGPAGSEERATGSSRVALRVRVRR